MQVVRCEHLSRTLQLAPSLLQVAGYVTSPVSYRTRAAICRCAGRRVLAAETAIAAGVVAVDHVACTAPADVVDRCSAAEITFEFFIEAEDGALAGAVDIAGAASAGGEGGWCARVETSQRGRAGGRAGVSGLGVLEADDVP